MAFQVIAIHVTFASEIRPSLELVQCTMMLFLVGKVDIELDSTLHLCSMLWVLRVAILATLGLCAAKKARKESC